MEKERFSGMFMDWVMTFLVVAILATVCNIVGYDGGFIESLPGMLIFGLISLAGLTVKHFVPGNLPAVAYIALIGRSWQCRFLRFPDSWFIGRARCH